MLNMVQIHCIEHANENILLSLIINLQDSLTDEKLKGNQSSHLSLQQLSSQASHQGGIFTQSGTTYF